MEPETGAVSGTRVLFLTDLLDLISGASMLPCLSSFLRRFQSVELQPRGMPRDAVVSLVGFGIEVETGLTRYVCVGGLAGLRLAVFFSDILKGREDFLLIIDVV